jgi:hypothetical protein
LIHMRCELMLRNPTNPSKAIAKRLENQNLGTEHVHFVNRLILMKELL